MWHANRIDLIAPVPPYQHIAEIIRRRIGAGQYRPDTRIPTESEIVGKFEVARTTARRAVHVLREEGLVCTVPNRGSYVTRQSPGRKVVNCHLLLPNYFIV
jgi:DNA-binding GntR family transcriptional regulator